LLNKQAAVADFKTSY